MRSLENIGFFYRVYILLGGKLTLFFNTVPFRDILILIKNEPSVDKVLIRRAMIFELICELETIFPLVFERIGWEGKEIIFLGIFRVMIDGEEGEWIKWMRVLVIDKGV